MNSLLKIVIMKFALLFLLCNFVKGETLFNTSNMTSVGNYTQEAITSLKVKTSCQTLTDCSEDALECKKDTNSNNSVCVYPEYLCTNAQTCFLVNEKNVSKDTLLQSPNNSTTYDCENGQCQINVDSSVTYCSVEGTGYQCLKLNGEKCTTDGDCLSSSCDKTSQTCKAKNNTTTTSKDEKKSESSSSNKTTIYVCIGIAIVVGIFIIVIFIIICIKHSNDVIENPDMYDIRSEKDKAAGGAVVTGILSSIPVA